MGNAGGSGRIQLGLLRGFTLIEERRAINLPVGAQRLLAFLALCDRPMMRHKVAGALWGDSSDARSSGNLRSTLWRVNLPGLNLVESGRSHLRLSPLVQVDVREVVRLAHGLLNGTEKHGGDFEQVDLAGDLLPDWDEDWLVVERERLRQLRLHALEALTELRISEGRFGEAVEAGLAAIASEPLRESAQRALIRVYVAEGNIGEALRQYRLYSELLLEEIGVYPSRQLQDMIESLRKR